MLPKGDNSKITQANHMSLQAAHGHDGAQHYSLLPPEQKALKKGTRGCFDALAIDAAVARECRKDKRDCSMLWLDFKQGL